jgi:hypothetical protein
MNLALEVKLRFEDLDTVVGAQTTNFGLEGIFIRMDPPKPVGTHVVTRLKVGASESFTLEGVVIRAVPDADEATPAPGQAPGIAIFLTSTSAGWARFCGALDERRRVIVQPPREGAFTMQVTEISEPDDSR